MNNSKGGRCPGDSPSEPPVQGYLYWGWVFRVTTVPGAVLLTSESQTRGRTSVSGKALTPTLQYIDYIAGDVTDQIWLSGVW